MKVTVSAAFLLGLSGLTAAEAATFEVRMVNKDSEGMAWQFEPAFLKISPGDTVIFIPTDKGHNSEALVEVTPNGIAPWKGKIDEPISITYSQPGVYAYKCLPHAALGMVGVIQVGDQVASVDLKNVKLAGKGKQRLDELLSQTR